ncbi:MAG: TRAP transporter small permease subunit [Pseudomonadota bacterium]|nr:TRAP transporter small permease subunit [Pseudomonadota bacterium]
MQAIAKAHDWLINALKTLSCLIVFAIFILIVMDVLLPLVGLQPWEGTLGVVEYGLLWFTILAAPWLARIKGHVFIDAVNELLAPGARKITSKIAYLVVIVGSLLLAYYSLELTIEAYVDEAIDERSIELELWWIYAPMPIGFFLVAVEFIRFLLGFDEMFGSRTDVREGM